MLLGTEVLNNSKPGQFMEERYSISANFLAAANRRVTSESGFRFAIPSRSRAI